jgi:hypothetical protein
MHEDPTPYALVFEAVAEERFPLIQQSLGESQYFDRDALLLQRPMVEVLHDLRPEEGLGSGMEELVALVHLAFLYWHYGKRSVRCGEGGLGEVVAISPGGPVPNRPETAYYVQLPRRRIWGSPADGDDIEPLDGCFLARTRDHLLTVAVFGIHPQRGGFTVVEVTGPRPSSPSRVDGTPLFAPVLEGGVRAGLFSLTGMEELHELAWRLDLLVGDRIYATDRLEVA